MVTTIAHEPTDAFKRYSIMRVGALRTICKEKGLPFDGRKEDLVNRLCNNCSSAASSGLINARMSSSVIESSSGAYPSKSPTEVDISERASSEGGITTPLGASLATSSRKGDGSLNNNRLTTSELHELASIADEIRHIRKQTEFSILRVAGLVTDYPPSSTRLAPDNRYGPVQKSTPYGYPVAPTSRVTVSLHHPQKQHKQYCSYER